MTLKTTYGNDYFETVSVQPGLNTLHYNRMQLLDFAVLVLAEGETYELRTEEREYGLVALTGTAHYQVESGGRLHRFEHVGGRTSVFSAPPSMVYVPCQACVTIQAITRTEVAIGSSPSATSLDPYTLGPEDALQGQWGNFNTTRTFNFLVNSSRPSERLHLAEVIVQSGNWATYPPHKHDETTANEIFQEELYYFRVEPDDGMGFCALYGDKVGGDYGFLIRNNTILKMPYGFHTVCAAPGYKVWYLAYIAGDTKAAKPLFDPALAWYAKTEVVLDNLKRNLLG